MPLEYPAPLRLRREPDVYTVPRDVLYQPPPQARVISQPNARVIPIEHRAECGWRFARAAQVLALVAIILAAVAIWGYMRGYPAMLERMALEAKP